MQPGEADGELFRHVIETYREVAGAKRRLAIFNEEEAHLLVDPTRLQSAAKAFGIEED